MLKETAEKRIMKLIQDGLAPIEIWNKLAGLSLCTYGGFTFYDVCDLHEQWYKLPQVGA